MKRTCILLSILMIAVLFASCEGYTDGYEGRSVMEVEGRQGIAYDGKYRYVSGTDSLIRYTWNWAVVNRAEDPLKGYPEEVNHLGDVTYYDGSIYAAAEYFDEGKVKNMQIGIYDKETLELTGSYEIDKSSGQTECSGVAADPDNGFIWVCSWSSGESGEYLYRYSLEDGKYLGKMKLDKPPVNIQGVAYFKEGIYLTADDGDCEKDQPDHMYLVTPDEDYANAAVTEEKDFTEVLDFGEIEGFTFMPKKKKLLVLQNRGAKIENGVPVGFYDDYEREFSEVYTYGVIN